MSQSNRYFAAAARSSLRPPTRGQRRGLAMLCLLLLGVGQAGCGDLGLSGSGQSLPQETPLRISPTRCSVLCGVRVTIIGLDMPAFGPGTEVLFGEVLASDIEIVDAETIRVTAPAQAAPESARRGPTENASRCPIRAPSPGAPGPGRSR